MKSFILGAPDPEMELIEELIRTRGYQVLHALDAAGKRVHPGNAYRAFALSGELPVGGTVYAVECGGPAVPAWAVVVDHHRPGDPGYGAHPEKFWDASSLGQVAAILDIQSWSLPVRFMLAAAADHCLAAAYAGRCPGIDPDALMQWRVETRAAFQKRPVEDIMADVLAARAALRAAPVVDLGNGQEARNLLDQSVPELPEAAAREGLCFISLTKDRDGRMKMVCQAGTPEQVKAFMDVYAKKNNLADVYGDPARGFAGGYLAG